MRGKRGDLKYTCLGVVLKRLMKERDIKLISLSYEVNIPYTTLYDWSEGVVPSNPDELMKLRDYFKVSTDYLLYGTDGDREELARLLEQEREQNTKLKNKLEITEHQLSFMDELVQEKNDLIKELKEKATIQSNKDETKED